MRRWGAVILLLAGLAPICGKALADPEIPSRTGSIVDLADLLEPFQEQPLAAQFATLKARNGVDFVVVTLPSLQGYPIETWGRLLGNGWSVGGKSGLGALLIVAPNDREVRIEIGDALSAMFPDTAAAAIIDRQILPNFRERRMSAGIVAGANAMIYQATKPAMVAESGGSTKRGSQAERSLAYDWSWLRDNFPSRNLLLFGLLVLVILFILYKMKAWHILDVSGDSDYPGRTVYRNDSNWGWFWGSSRHDDRGDESPRSDPGGSSSSVSSNDSDRSSGFSGLGRSSSWGGFSGSGGSRSFGGSSGGRSSGGSFSGRGASGRW